MNLWCGGIKNRGNKLEQAIDFATKKCMGITEVAKALIVIDV